MENGMDDSATLKVNRRELAWIWFQGLSLGKSPQELKGLLVSSSKKWQSSLSPMARRLIEIEGPPSGDWVAFKSEGKAGSSHALLGREELRLERGSWQVFLRTCLRDRLTLITLPQSEGLQEVLNAMPVIGIKGVPGAFVHPLSHSQSHCAPKLSGEVMAQVLSLILDRVGLEHPQLEATGRRVLPLLTRPGCVKALLGSMYSLEVLPLVMEWELPGYGRDGASAGVLELRIAVSCADALDPIEFYAELAKGRSRELELTHVPSEVIDWLIRACVLVDVETASFLPFEPDDDEVPLLRTGADAALGLLACRGPGFLVPMASPEFAKQTTSWDTPEVLKGQAPEVLVSHWKAFIAESVLRHLSC